jgi:hypothetical protein
LNRFVAIALLVVCFPLTAQAQLPESAQDKQKRIDLFQDRRLIYEVPKDAPYSLRQGPDPIYDVDFVHLMNDPSLTNFWRTERNKDFAFWVTTGVVAVPLGALLFLDNFKATGPLALFSSAQRPAGANAGDPKAFLLSVLGAGLASYGMLNLTLWLLETLDLRHPNRLDADSIAPRVKDWNDRLRDRLNLEPSDIPSPPTPRPSVTPSGSASPSSPPGIIPSAPVGGPGSLPLATSPAPKPLDVISPGQTATEPPASSRPSTFAFPDSSPRPTPLPS